MLCVNFSKNHRTDSRYKLLEVAPVSLFITLTGFLTTEQKQSVAFTWTQILFECTLWKWINVQIKIYIMHIVQLDSDATRVIGMWFQTIENIHTMCNKHVYLIDILNKNLANQINHTMGELFLVFFCEIITLYFKRWTDIIGGL